MNFLIQATVASCVLVCLFVVLIVMSGMTGYETGATYPAPQYAYEGDPRHQAGGWGVQYQPHPHQQVPGQGSPTERYPYYDNR